MSKVYGIRVTGEIKIQVDKINNRGVIKKIVLKLVFVH